MNMIVRTNLKKINSRIPLAMEKVAKDIVFINIDNIGEAYHVICDMYLVNGKFVGFDIEKVAVMNETDAYNASVIITKNGKGEFKKWVSTTMTCHVEH